MGSELRLMATVHIQVFTTTRRSSPDRHLGNSSDLSLPHTPDDFNSRAVNWGDEEGLLAPEFLNQITPCE